MTNVLIVGGEFAGLNAAKGFESCFLRFADGARLEAMTTAEWLANCSSCCVPEIAGAFAVTRREVVPGLGTRAELDAFIAARS